MVLEILKKLRFPKETGWGWWDGLGICDGNAIKSGYDDHCTTVNVIKFIELKKRKKFLKIVLGKLDSYMQKNEAEHYLTPQKNKLKMDQRPKYKARYS